MQPAARLSAVRAVVEWYFATYHGRPGNIGTPATFFDPGRVGAFAISPAAFRRGDGAALFRLLVATTLFQRRQDQQVLRVLRRIERVDVRELTTPSRLIQLSRAARCPYARGRSALHEDCDLAKHPRTRRGICDSRPRTPCHLKRHTELLGRYGDFGKMPTSAALLLEERGVDSLPRLREAIFASTTGEQQRALELELALRQVWRIEQKIACMFLSLVCNPAFDGPWANGLDWTRYVVIDSNVDHFLDSVGLLGGTYDDRRTVVQDLARRVDLSQLEPGMPAFNPRIVQQALYIFMSASNRRAAPEDCSLATPSRCPTCPRPLKKRCALVQ